MLSIIKKLFGSSEAHDSDGPEGELWIMIKETSFFREDAHLAIVDELAESMEGKGLGELDGHSSGGHQFEINFYEVRNYNQCKAIVTEYFSSKYPELEYTISEEYETTYEKL